jgi:hypothetical protein
MRTENTFEGGMHVDNDFSEQPKGTYRFSKNGYVFSIGEKNFIWSPAIGNVQVEDYPSNYKPIGMFSAREKIIVLSVNEDDDLGSIGWLYLLNGVYLFTYGYVRPNSELNFSTSNPIRGYSYYENSETERIYWSDSVQKPKSLNIPAINFGMSYVSGKKYLVLFGQVEHNGFTYYAGDAFVYWTYTGFSMVGDTRIIEYFEPIILDWNPNLLFDKITSASVIDGTLDCASYAFTYRFLTEFDNVTPWAPLSELYTIMSQNGTTEDPDDFPAIKNWNFLQGALDKFSERGLRITLDGIPFDKYQYVEFAAFKYKNEVVDTGVIFSKVEIPKVRPTELLGEYSNTITADIIQYTGEYLTLEQYAIQSISLLSVNDLDIIKDIQSVSGTEEEGDIGIGNSMDNTNITEPVRTCIYEIPADVLNHTDYDNDKPLSGIYGYDSEGYVSSGQILKGQYYKVKKFDLTYESTPYIVGDIFLGTTSATFISAPGFPAKAKPVIRICEYIDNTNTPIFKYIEMDDAPLPKGTLATQFAGYWGKEIYRVGVLPISLTGKFLPVRHVLDYQVPDRSLTNATSVDMFNEDGSFTSVINLLTSGPHTRLSPSSDEEKYQYNVNIDSLLVSVDLTDIINQISGFCIVRAVRDKGVMSEGFIDPVHKLKHYYYDTAQSSYLERNNFYRCSHFNIRNTPFIRPLWTSNVFIETLLKKYYYTNPEIQMNKETFEGGDTMQLVRKYGGDIKRDNSYIRQTGEPYDTIPFGEITATNKEFYTRCFKAYNELVLTENNTESVDLKTLDIIDSAKEDFDVATEEDNFFNYAPGDNVRQIGAGSLPLLIWQDPACKSALIEIDYNRQWFVGFESDGTDKLPETVYVTEHKRGSSVYTTNDNLGTTEYIFTGHYQKVDAAFKAAIKYGENYIAKDIQIFGGDTHVNLFGIARVIPDGMHVKVGDELDVTVKSFGDYVIVPLQSRYNSSSVIGRNGALDNIGVKDGTSICANKFKPFETVGNTVPRYFSLEPNYFESNEYTEKGFIDDNKIKFPGLAPFASTNNIYLNRIRHSSKKQVGFAIDEFLDFPALNKIDIPGDNGLITNIRAKGSRLFVWQESAIGYIPVGERALTSGGLEATIQLGTGDQFLRYDIINETYGNQDKLSLIETDANWFWFDFYRKTLLMMEFNGQWKPESVLKGMDSYFQNTLPNRDNMVIRSGYDPKAKVVLFSFIDLIGSATKTISINTKNGKFNGEHEFVADLYSNTLNELFSVKNDYELIYLHNQDTGLIYGKSYQCQISFIVNHQNDEMKKFMSAIFRGGRTFFDTVKYETMYDFDSGVFLNIVEEAGNTTNYEFVIDEWRAGIPEGDYGRMDGRYMLVTLTVGSTDSKLRLRKMITEYLKQH